ncbi:MAG TPA: GNAT family N-acetyltransferase [Fimbriimonadaceae bacterium]|nr:GNAT family N-acetyltransferase [Fimbriimonadaceae bacterium]
MIRRAQLSDAAAIAELAGQLGYPTDPDEMQHRLSKMLHDPQRTILVAEVDGKVVGWTTIKVEAELTQSPYGLVSGLVVDERHRGRGIGQELLEAAENWAAEQGLARLRLRANEIREDAHRFYLRNEFEMKKKQCQFEKELGRE